MNPQFGSLSPLAMMQMMQAQQKQSGGVPLIQAMQNAFAGNPSGGLMKALMKPPAPVAGPQGAVPPNANQMQGMMPDDVNANDIGLNGGGGFSGGLLSSMFGGM